MNPQKELRIAEIVAKVAPKLLPCDRCQRRLPPSRFYREKARPTGYGRRCRSCESERKRRQPSRRPSHKAPKTTSAGPSPETARILHTLARHWIEYEGLSHLLPDPHSHDDLRGLVALHYSGGIKAFLADADHLAGTR